MQPSSVLRWNLVAFVTVLCWTGSAIFAGWDRGSKSVKVTHAFLFPVIALMMLVFIGTKSADAESISIKPGKLLEVPGSVERLIHPGR